MKAQIIVASVAAIAIFNSQQAIAQVDPDLVMCRGDNRRDGCLKVEQPYCKEGQTPTKDNCRPLIFLPE